MADITMCKDDKCPMKEKCYRFNAKPFRLQPYFALSPRNGLSCDYFLDMSKKLKKP